MYWNRFKFLSEAGEADGSAAAADAQARGDFVQEDDAAATKESPAAAEKVTDKLSDDAEDKAKTGDEGEETDEEKAEREAEEAKAAKKANIRVPKARLDEVTQKARAREADLKRQIDELQNKLTGKEAKTEVDRFKAEIDSMQDKYEDLVQEGRKDEARAIRKKIDAAREELAEYRLATASDRARAAAMDDLRYDAALANVEAKFPALNPDHEAFDEELSTEVVTLLEAFLAKGFTRAAALQKSVKYVMGPDHEPTKEDEKDTTSTLRAKQQADARKKVADAASRTPPNTNKVGENSDKHGERGNGKGIDVMRLSQAEFKKLDEQTLSDLRGDTVE